MTTLKEFEAVLREQGMIMALAILEKLKERDRAKRNCDAKVLRYEAEDRRSHEKTSITDHADSGDGAAAVGRRDGSTRHSESRRRDDRNAGGGNKQRRQSRHDRWARRKSRDSRGRDQRRHEDKGVFADPSGEEMAA